MWIFLHVFMIIATIGLGVFIYHVARMAFRIGWSGIDTAFACFLGVVYAIMVYTLIKMWFA